MCDYTNTPNDQFIARPIATPEIKADSYEVSPSLLNLITREQFDGNAMEDASMHLHDFVEICDMQKFKNVEEYPTKNEMHSFILHTKSRMKKTNNTLSEISLKMEKNIDTCQV